MRDWWLNLSLRDKRILSLGGMFLTLFLCYDIFFASISNANDALRDSIAHDQKLLTWMKIANSRIETFQTLSDKNIKPKNPAALLSILQKEINTSPFANNLKHLTQGENNSVQVELQKINFDMLISWLTTLWQKDGITLIQITTTPDGPLGIVDASLQLH